MSIQLGSKVKDIVSGFTGIATARIEYLNGCIQIKVVHPVDKTGEVKECWFDIQQVQVLGKGIAVQKKETGGPVGSMPKAGHP